MKKGTRSLATGPVYADIVDFPEDAYLYFEALVVELISFIYPSNEITPEFASKVVNGWGIFAKAIFKTPEVDGALASGWGQIEFEHEGVKSRRWTCLIGWKSVEDHYACKKTAPFKDNIHHLMDHGRTGIEMRHYAYWGATM